MERLPLYLLEGKKKCGFELNVECSLTGMFGDSKAEVKVTISNIDADSLDDLEISYEVEKGTDKSNLRSTCQTLSPILKETFRQLKDDLEKQ